MPDPKLNTDAALVLLLPCAYLLALFRPYGLELLELEPYRLELPAPYASELCMMLAAKLLTW